ncbi:MAG: Na(+)/H(+) antiporter subunit B [Maricaulaceae bacterium]
MSEFDPPQRSDKPTSIDDIDDAHVVLRAVAKLLIPIITLFAFYVQFHGDYSPGGGFQAGVILAVAVILFALVFGLREAKRAVPPGFAKALAAAGVLLYGGVGLVTFALGGEYLDYDVLIPDSEHHAGQHVGILLVELGVLSTVSGVMMCIFYAFASREPDITDEDW